VEATRKASAKETKPAIAICAKPPTKAPIDGSKKRTKLNKKSSKRKSNEQGRIQNQNTKRARKS